MLDNPYIDEDFEMDQRLLANNGLTILKTQSKQYYYQGHRYDSLKSLPASITQMPREDSKNTHCRNIFL